MLHFLVNKLGIILLELSVLVSCIHGFLMIFIVEEFGEAIKNPAYRIPQTEYSGCLDISAHA